MATCCEDEAMSEDPSTSTDSAASELLSLSLGPVESEREKMRERMLERLSNTSAHFAHRQIGSPDLTSQEKVDIAAEILDRSPALFLARFGKFLQASDVPFFQQGPATKESYEIAFHLKDIEHRCSHRRTIVKNRRFSAMRELEEGGVYFSEDEMKQRDPLLYEEMIGRFLTEEERAKKETDSIDRSDLRFSTILLKHMDIVRERELYRFQKEREECQEEEEEDSEEEDEDDEDEEEEKESCPRLNRNKKTAMEEEEDEEDEDEAGEEEAGDISAGRVSDIVRQQLREEFKAIMQEKFLTGGDAQFDYSKVDDNPDYDSLLMESQDEENRYFHSEDPMTTVDRDTGSDTDSAKCPTPVPVPVAIAAPAAAAKMMVEEGKEKEEEEQEEEEEEDYMMYEPSVELVAKSARFVRTGAWTEAEMEEDDGGGGGEG